ncbi:hypothetical protein BCV69DRAFT_295907 [Microstroma glucosiphilum]|uniref:DASH complex subunit DAD1 n=1 Tax=Pseudomicrostroma glucosiphilum TaxID=1684307 RepID=A0A316UEE8_9BASI|nr:hypothetical protein BCV69DRAFT_295907 [Pseudomicrostroma glucosiphilum]PWN23589.1 hypothetical protein BCV69DRAFT_295907 [Pseudomicrostroma glucosiphilum]
MSRDTETPSPPPPSTAQPQSNAAAVSGSGGSSFFLRERERLLGEIAESMGQILNNSNALNRKLEESILVGKEFEPVAALWGRFASSMASMGVPNPQEYDGAGSAGANGAAGVGGDEIGMGEEQGVGGEEREGFRRSVPAAAAGAGGETMPLGVAPGGGSWSAAPPSGS